MTNILTPGIGRSAILLLWLFSVYLAVQGGFQPGLVSPEQRTSFPYPWVGVILTCFHTAVYAGLLYWLILRPGMTLRRQVAKALVIFAIVSLIHAVLFATDFPGYAYVPGQFAMLLTVLLLIAWLVAVGASIRKRSRPMI